MTAHEAREDRNRQPEAGNATVARDAHTRAAIYFVLAVGLGIAAVGVGTTGYVAGVILLTGLTVASAILSGIHTLAGFVLANLDKLRVPPDGTS